MSNRGSFYVPFNKESHSTKETRINKIDILLASQVELGEEYGYYLDSDFFTYLLEDNVNGLSYDVEDINVILGNLKIFLNTYLGVDVEHKPLFKKFPMYAPNHLEYLSKRIFGLMENIAPELSLDLLRILNISIDSGDEVVLSNGIKVDKTLFNLDEFNACPITQMQVDELSNDDEYQEKPLNDSRNLKSISLATSRDVLSLFNNILSSNTPISSKDKEFINSVFDYMNNPISVIPDTIPQKETASFISKKIVECSSNWKDAVEIIQHRYIKTATDVLRLAESLSGIDPSLTSHSRFKITLKGRKVIMSLLDGLNDPLEDMLRYRGLWLVLGKYLHIGSYKEYYPDAFHYMDTLRNNHKSIITFDSLVESAIIEGNKERVISLLKERPGVFARRIDHLLRRFDSDMVVAEAFVSVADEVSVPLLVNLSTFLKNRDIKDKTRVFTPKGTLNANIVKGDTRETLTTEVCQYLSLNINRILMNTFSKKESLGNVYIDPSLKDVFAPTSMRGNGSDTQPLTKGSKIPFNDDESNILRMFCYWKENETSGRVDVDISLMAFDEDMNFKEKVSYYNYHNNGTTPFTYSGDRQSAPNGASEFIDVDIEKCLEQGIRYVMLTTNVYTGQSFNKFKAMGGFMTRRNNTGKAFEAKTLENKYEIDSVANFAFPMAFDLIERKMIWVNTGITNKGVANNLDTNSESVSNLMIDILNEHKRKTILYDFFMLHAITRSTNGVSITNKHFDEMTDEEKGQFDTVIDMSIVRKMDEIVSHWMS